MITITGDDDHSNDDDDDESNDNKNYDDNDCDKVISGGKLSWRTISGDEDDDDVQIASALLVKVVNRLLKCTKSGQK